MHRHGSYRRKRCGGTRVERFCCPVCRLSCTVLPAGLLPYRSSRVQELEQHFDQSLAAESVREFVCGSPPEIKDGSDQEGTRSGRG
jgi:hypothetical protein